MFGVVFLEWLQWLQRSAGCSGQLDVAWCSAVVVAAVAVVVV